MRSMTERELTGLRGRDRGQTTQDFAVGISVFLLTVTFTFTFVPTTITPFGSPVTDAIPAKSDRVAATNVDSYGTDDRSRTLDVAQVDSNLMNISGSDLRDQFGLRSTAQVNVTIRDLDGNIVSADLDGTGGDEKLTSGDTYPPNQAAASTTRVVRLPGIGGCETGCLLVVRVW